jgi:hypothetical protein
MGRASKPRSRLDPGLLRCVEAQQFGGGGFNINSKKVFAPRGRADQSCYKVGPLRARVKSAKVRPTPYVYYPRVQHVEHSAELGTETPNS